MPSTWNDFGVFPQHVLRRRGLTRHRICRMVDDGALRSLRRGWYATPTAHPDVVDAVEHGAALSGAHRLHLMGAWLPHRAVRHVWASRRATVTTTAAVVHRRPLLSSDQVARGAVPWPVALQHHLHSGCPLVDRVTVVGSLRMPIPRDPEHPVAEPYRPPLAELHESVASAPDGSTIWRLSGLPCDNGFELQVATLLRLHGLRVQVQVLIEGGRWRIDIVVEGRVAIELDGRTHHSSAQHHADVRKAGAIARHGLVLLRFGYAQVMEQWPMVLATISAAL